MEKITLQSIMEQVRQIELSGRNDPVIEIKLTRQNCVNPQEIAEKLKFAYRHDATFPYDISSMKENGDVYVHFHRSSR